MTALPPRGTDTPAVPTEAVEAAMKAHARHEYTIPGSFIGENRTCVCGFDFIAAEVSYWRHKHESVAAAVLATVDVRKAQAQAWDEGVRRCDRAWHEGDAVSVFDRNPYRENGADE